MGINVLSLFDGISCGQLALKRAKIDVDNYFASEIDPNAIKVTQYHFPNTIQLGDVTKVQGKNLPKIDLLIGGSPCQGFSMVGNRLNFKDPRSILFFDYVRLLKEINPKYFLLENVPMGGNLEGAITKILKVLPMRINSSYFSAQNRKRLYWSNIPGVTMPKDRKILFNKWMYSSGRSNSLFFKRNLRFCEKSPTILTSSTRNTLLVEYSDVSFAKKQLLLYGEERGHLAEFYNQFARELTPEEREELQTLPVGYTSMLKKTHRNKLTGNCWTVEAVYHILKEIKPKVYRIRLIK